MRFIMNACRFPFVVAPDRTDATSVRDAAVGNWAEIRVGHGGGDEPAVDHADRHWEVTPVKSNFPRALIGRQPLQP